MIVLLKKHITLSEFNNPRNKNCVRCYLSGFHWGRAQSAHLQGRNEVHFAESFKDLGNKSGFTILIIVLRQFCIFLKDAIFKNCRSPSGFLTVGFFPLVHYVELDFEQILTLTVYDLLF